MLRVLTARLAPSLRQRGFTGSMPHFRRLLVDETHLLTVQFDKNGGGFVIELAKCPASALTKPWGKVIPRDKLTAHDINPPRRKRLQPRARIGADGWFRFDRELSMEEVATDVLRLLPQVDAWFAGEANQPNIR